MGRAPVRSLDAGAVDQLRPPRQPGREARPSTSSSAPRSRHLHFGRSRADMAPIRVGRSPARRPVGTADGCISGSVRGPNEAALERRSRIAHRRLIADIVAETAIGVQSPLEFRWMKQIERPHRLPIPTRPYRLPSGAVADGAYEEFRVLLELDGRRYHDGERRFRDWRRDNLSSEDGWLTLRYGWHDTVVESCATAGNLVRVLRRRGYDGELARCTHCNV
jgi:hypothetical protein